MVARHDIPYTGQGGTARDDQCKGCDYANQSYILHTSVTMKIRKVLEAVAKKTAPALLTIVVALISAGSIYGQGNLAPMPPIQAYLVEQSKSFDKILLGPGWDSDGQLQRSLYRVGRLTVPTYYSDREITYSGVTVPLSCGPWDGFFVLGKHQLWVVIDLGQGVGWLLLAPLPPASEVCSVVEILAPEFRRAGLSLGEGELLDLEPTLF